MYNTQYTYDSIQGVRYRCFLRTRFENRLCASVAAIENLYFVSPRERYASLERALDGSLVLNRYRLRRGTLNMSFIVFQHATRFLLDGDVVTRRRSGA